MMKAKLLKLGMVVTLAASLGACSNMTTAQRNTAMGAAAGAVAGNLLGNSTAATLGGAALGGVIGSQVKYLPVWQLKKQPASRSSGCRLLFCVWLAHQ